jgi:mannose-6-phosphate isomerase-like protein (cupin superfamily)
MIAQVVIPLLRTRWAVGYDEPTSQEDTMTRFEFEAEVRREGYEVREGEIKPHVHRELHAHEFDARLFVLKGSLTMVFDTDRVTYGPGDSCSVPAGTMHAEHTEADSVHFVFGKRPVSLDSARGARDR